MITVSATRFDLQFRFFGVASRVHWTFWLGGMFFVSRSSSAFHVVAGIVCLFVSIFVHEMGHALSGRYYGDRSPSIVLHGVGGYYMAGTVNLRYGKKIWMCLWGPFAGFILGALALGLYFAMLRGLLPPNERLWYVINCLIWINVLWGAANLLPVYHLDGGQIMLEIVRWKFPLKTDATAYTISLVVALVVVVLSLAAVFIYGSEYLFAAILFGSLAYQNYHMRKIDILTGGHYEEEAKLEPWERDADWWKGGGSGGKGSEEQDADWWKK